MKKAKLILSALAILAIFGTAVAFKVAKYNGNPLFTTTSLSSIRGGFTYTAADAVCTAIPNEFATLTGTNTTLALTICTVTTTTGVTVVGGVSFYSSFTTLQPIVPPVTTLYTTAN